MNRVRVKICGITRPEDAITASDAGADAIGMVFYTDSPRAVTIDAACSIVKALPPFITKVGLFVNNSADYIHSILNQVGLDVLQFHGDENQEECSKFGMPYIKAVRMKEGVDLSLKVKEYDQSVAILADAYVAGVPGGTGKTINWNLIESNIGKPLILAGGLTPENVNEAIRKVNPYAVDVSGGVESDSGIKDKSKILKFIQRIQEQDK